MKMDDDDDDKGQDGDDGMSAPSYNTDVLLRGVQGSLEA
jgi:hypothetical protein